MKNLLFTIALFLAATTSAFAQKALYIPNEWKNPYPSDSLLYKESDPDNKYTWSKSRSKETDNVIVYWDKYYGNTNPSNAPATYKVDIDDLLNKAEAFYALNVGKLAFCEEAKSKVSKYKIMILLNHTTTWTCYGGGYDFMVPALWLNPATCKPVGHSVAHEVGHSFQYMCYSDAGGHAGFHDAIGNGSTFWEQTAQWQANQSYPELKWNQSWFIFKNTANYAMTHEWMRYQSYWWHYYLVEKYGIDFIGKIWRHQMAKAADPNEVYMDLMGYSVEDLYRDYFDYAMKMATIDLDVARSEAAPYIGTYMYHSIPLGGTKHQVAYSSCPQATGFNIIPLNVPAAGTTISTEFTSLKQYAPIADNDPRQYFNGDNFVTLQSKRFYNSVTNYKNRGFRLGYVALLQDGTRQYFSEDKVYCTGVAATQNASCNVSCTVPENTERLFLVVSPAPSTYYQHKWDEDISNDDQWPYTVEFTGTNILGSPILGDDYPITDATITYDVQFPRSTSTYPAITFNVDGDAASALGTAFQMQASELASHLTAWKTAGPADGQAMFYAVSPAGTITNSGSSANGYGHWFNASGSRSDYSSGYLYSEFDPATLSFTLGQYPSKVTTGKTYTIRQAFKYKRGAETATVTFVFNITIASGTAKATVSDVKIDDFYTDIHGVPSADTDASASPAIYSLSGTKLSSPQRGINIIKTADGKVKKVLMK